MIMARLCPHGRAVNGLLPALGTWCWALRGAAGLHQFVKRRAGSSAVGCGALRGQRCLRGGKDAERVGTGLPGFPPWPAPSPALAVAMPVQAPAWRGALLLCEVPRGLARAGTW